MGWLSTIGSLAPTIGTIVGSLLGGVKASDEMGVVSYDFTNFLPLERQKLSSTNSFKATFVKDGDNYLLVNQSTNKNDTVTISTPAMGDLEPSSITIPGLFNNTLNVNSLFKYNAEHDNSVVELTASPGGTFSNSRDSLENSDTPMCMTASARNVEVDNKDYKRISPYLSVKAKQDSIELKAVGGVNLSGVRSLSIEGTGDSSIMITNVDVDSPREIITVNLPHKLVSNDNIRIDTMVEMTSLKAILELQQKRGVVLQTASPQLLSKLETAVVLNKR